MQFSISTHFSSFGPIGRTLSGATAPGQSGPGINGNYGVLCIPQSSSITGTLPSDCLVSYAGHWLESYPSAEKQSVYSTAPADRTKYQSSQQIIEACMILSWLFYLVLRAKSLFTECICGLNGDSGMNSDTRKK